MDNSLHNLSLRSFQLVFYFTSEPKEGDLSIESALFLSFSCGFTFYIRGVYDMVDNKTIDSTRLQLTTESSL